MADPAEPELAMDERMTRICAELAALEPLFHHPEVGAGREALEQLTSEDFWEVGASGRRMSREFVLGVLLARGVEAAAADWAWSGFHCRELAPGTMLLTYDLDQAGRVSRRTTIWRRDGERWRAAFHQGTLIQPLEADG